MRLQFNSLVGDICWRKDRLTTLAFVGFPCGLSVNDSTCNVGDLGLIPGLERFLGEGKPTHSSILAWRIPWTIQSRGVAKSLTWLDNFHFYFTFMTSVNSWLIDWLRKIQNKTFFFNCIYLLAVLAPPFSVGLFSNCSVRPLIAVASLLVEHRLQGTWAQ